MVTHSLPRAAWADLITLLLLNCHLTGKNLHSYTPCPWRSCGKFLIKISGEGGAGLVSSTTWGARGQSEGATDWLGGPG